MSMPYSDKALAVEQRLTALLTGDAWRTASMINGWTGGDPLHYRLSIDKRKVVLHTTGMTPGTTTNGTQITTLAAGYRPTSQCVVPCTSDVLGTQAPHLTIHVDGTVYCFGVAGTATYFACEAEFAIDI